MDEAPLAISVEEACRLLGIRRTLGYRLVRSGELPSCRLGGRIVVPRRSLELLLGRDPGGEAARRAEAS